VVLFALPAGWLRFSALLALTFGLSLVAGGCQFQHHREQLAALHAQGAFTQALAELNDPKVKSLYEERDRLVYDLDRGILNFYTGQDAPAIVDLERAEALMDRQREPSAADTAAQWLLNDTASTYVGEPYEDVYVNVFKLLAQLRQGRVEGGATVEARRIASKTTWLRDRYQVSQGEARSAAGQRGVQVDGQAAGPYGDAATGGQFIDSPLGTYLAAVVFMKTGEAQMQRVAARRLADAIARQQEIIGPVRAEAFAGLEQIEASEANVLLVALSGRGPTKVARRVGPIPVGTVPVYFELPELVSTPSEVVGVRATLTAIGEIAAAVPVQVLNLNLVENLGMVATENHRRQMPLIYARTLIRAAAKSTASYVATEAIRRGQPGGRREADGEAVLAVLAGLALITATERADVRCWAFLPGQAHVGLASVPTGRYVVKMEFLVPGGVGYTQTQEITVGQGDGALGVGIGHWWK